MNFLVLLGIAAGLSAGADLPRQNAFAPRRLPARALVCVHPPLNLTGQAVEPGKTVRELAERLREAGFRLGSSSCDATVFTEIVAAGRNQVELQFRVVFSDEQIPRLCTSVRGSLGEAFAREARQIRDAQDKGMAIYKGAIE